MIAEILIVDDNSDIRNILNDLIIDAGYSTRVAANYNQALSEIDKKIPDVAILDVKLDKGDNDGIQLLSHIKSKDKNVPVIMSEVGCIGYVDGKTEGPKNPEDCGKYAQDLYKFYVLNNIPITWWALEKEKTIYKRAIKGGKNFLPFDLIPDNHLFKGLRLNLN